MDIISAAVGISAFILCKHVFLTRVLLSDPGSLFLGSHFFSLPTIGAALAHCTDLYVYLFLLTPSHFSICLAYQALDLKSSRPHLSHFMPGTIMRSSATTPWHIFLWLVNPAFDLKFAREHLSHFKLLVSILVWVYL